MVKYIIVGVILNVFLSGCTINETPGELAVSKYNHTNDFGSLDIKKRNKIQILENEINNIAPRGNKVNYHVESLTLDGLNKTKFIHKNLSTEISSYKEITFSDIHESVNLLVSEVHESETIDYSQTLKLFQSHLKSYSQSNDILLFNIDQKSFYGAEAKNNVFCVMEAFDTETHNVLLIEINEGKQTKFWVHYKNLFDRIMLRRNYSYCTSGWLRISKSTQFTEYYSKLK